MTRGVRRPPTLEDDGDDEFVDAHSSESSDAAAGMEINLEKERSKRARPPTESRLCTRQEGRCRPPCQLWAAVVGAKTPTTTVAAKRAVIPAYVEIQLHRQYP
ncbi:hypothetical protein ACJJTC_013639 [Scirpophaga incertulas]